MSTVVKAPRPKRETAAIPPAEALYNLLIVDGDLVLSAADVPLPRKQALEIMAGLEFDDVTCILLPAGNSATSGKAAVVLNGHWLDKLLPVAEAEQLAAGLRELDYEVQVLPCMYQP